MKRLIVAICLAIAGWSSAGFAIHPALASGLCVGTGPGCYSTIQAALDAAHAGDVIHIGPGTFAGGVTIDKSVSLVGAGPNATSISGGNSVLTIGTFRAPSEPTVSIDGVRITGGVAGARPDAPGFARKIGAITGGGGIEIPPNADFSGGATVSVSNSVITGNRVAPTTAVDSGIPCPPDITIPCINGNLPFAQASGGGIDNWGTLKVTNTSITNNLVGAAAAFPSVASDADGGGIMNERSSPSLTISNTIISGNQASVVAPNGRFADTGGIFDDAGTPTEASTLTVANSVVTNNQANLATGMPSDTPGDVPGGTLAIAGGVHVGQYVTSASIRNTTISDNSISATNTVGNANAFSGGLHTDGTFTLSNDVIAGNSVTVTTLPGSTGNAYADSGAGEMFGTIDNTRLTGNSVTVSAVAGNASAQAGAAIDTGTMTNSVVSGNSLQAHSANGAAIVAGGGLVTAGPTTLRNTAVNDNTGDARGSSGKAQGGGIFAVDQSPNGPGGGLLSLLNSSIMGNAITGSAGVTVQGGGLFVTDPLTQSNSTITGNVPDNCFGSSC